MLVKLKDIATYINGKAFKPSEWVETGLPIIRIQNLNNPSKEYNYFDKEVHEKYIVENGDILISWSATLDIFEWKREKALLNQHIFKVVFDKEIEIDKSYFKLAISSVLHTMEKYTHGSTMKHIVKKDFENIKIPLPPLKKQKTIAKTLDKAKELIELRKESIVKLDELSRSVFVDMFGDPMENPMDWKKDKADNYIELLTGYPFKSKDYSQNKNDIKLCGGLIITPIGIEWDKANLWNKNDTSHLEKYWLEVDDIVMAMDRPWISTGFKIYQIKKQDIGTLLVQRTARIRSNILNLKFLYFLYKEPYFELQARVTETTIPHISPKDIRNYDIIIPPIDLQQKFAKTIQKIEAQKSLYEEELKKLEYNFEALLNESFS